MLYVDAVRFRKDPDCRNSKLPSCYCYLFADTKDELTNFMHRHITGTVHSTYSEIGLPHVVISSISRRKLLLDGLVCEPSQVEINRILTKYRMRRYTSEEIATLESLKWCPHSDSHREPTV